MQFLTQGWNWREGSTKLLFNKGVADFFPIDIAEVHNNSTLAVLGGYGASGLYCKQSTY